MHSTFYNYTNLLDFINDIIKNKKIWTRYGIIDGFSISNNLSIHSDGYISLFIKNNNIIQNLSKFVFSFDQFKNIVFSNEIHGIEFYKKKFPLKQTEEILSDWDKLSLLEKNEYLKLGEILVDDLDRFPSFQFPQIAPIIPKIEIKKDEYINLKNTFKLNTGLHKFSINNEILFHVYYDYVKNNYLISVFSNLINESKDALDKINIYIEDMDLFIQNKIETDISIKIYTNYI